MIKLKIVKNSLVHVDVIVELIEDLPLEEDNLSPAAYIPMKGCTWRIPLVNEKLTWKNWDKYMPKVSFNEQPLSHNWQTSILESHLEGEIVLEALHLINRPYITVIEVKYAV